MYGGPRTKLRLVPIPLHTFCPDAEYHYSPDTNYTNLVENSWDDRTRNGRRESTLPNTQSTKVLQWSWSPYAHEPFEWNNNENYLSIVKNNGAVLISTEFTLQLIDSIAICTSRAHNRLKFVNKPKCVIYCSMNWEVQTDRFRQWTVNSLIYVINKYINLVCRENIKFSSYDWWITSDLLSESSLQVACVCVVVIRVV